MASRKKKARKNATLRRWLTPNTERLLEAFLSAAEDTGMPYAIGGALAMGVHGYRRNTADVDAFVLYKDRVEWLRALRNQGLIVITMFQGVQYRAMLPGLTEENDPYIDVLVPAEEPALSAIDVPDAGVIDGYHADIWPVSLLVVGKFDSTRDKDAADVGEMYERGMFDPSEIRAIMLNMNDKALARRFWLKYGGKR